MTSLSAVNANSFARYMLVASAIGSLYKMNASISGAEIGFVRERSAWPVPAAAGLAELLGGSPARVCIAAEIAMEQSAGVNLRSGCRRVEVYIERNAI